MCVCVRVCVCVCVCVRACACVGSCVGLVSQQWWYIMHTFHTIAGRSACTQKPASRTRPWPQVPAGE